MKPVTLITGASAGIGAELARVFVRNGHELVLVARREDRLIALADEIAAAGRPRPVVLAIDLQQRDAVTRIAAELTTRGLEPAIVVNNAGFGLAGVAATRAALASSAARMSFVEVLPVEPVIATTFAPRVPSSRRHARASA